MPTTLADIDAAVQRLTSTNQRISVRSVRRALGGGSPNVLAALLRQWRAAQMIPGSTEAPAQMVAEIAGVAPRLWSLALEEARRHVQVEMEHLTEAHRQAASDTEEIQGLLDAAEERLQQTVDERQRAVAASEALHSRFVAADAQLATAVRQLSDTHAALYRQQIMAEHAESRRVRAEEAHAAEQQSHAADLLARDGALDGLRQALSACETRLAVALAEQVRSTEMIRHLEAADQERDRRMIEQERQSAANAVRADEHRRHLAAEVAHLHAAADGVSAQLSAALSRSAVSEQERQCLAEIRTALNDSWPRQLDLLRERMSAVEIAMRERPLPDEPSP